MLASKNTSKLVFYYDDLYVLFFCIANSKTNAVRKILISDLESASKNASIKRKKGFIFGYVHKVKFYQYHNMRHDSHDLA